jgi:hypothetical protein
VKSGYVETFATTLFTDGDGLQRQQGTFSVSLKNSSEDRPEFVLEKLQIKLGTVVGELVAQGPVLLHTLTNDDRSGIIVSDVGFPTSFVPVTQCVVEITEVLTELTGYGVYEGLDPSGSITVKGELNGCTGQNTFDVTEGELCFRAPL